MPARRRNPEGAWGLRASSSLLGVGDVPHRLLLAPRSHLASLMRAAHAVTRTGLLGSECGAVLRIRATNHIWVAAIGPSQGKGLALHCSMVNCRASRARSTFQLNAL